MLKFEYKLEGVREMKAIVCEMCGSNDVVKQDGFYVCQHCNTKYSVEEAKNICSYSEYISMLKE